MGRGREGRGKGGRREGEGMNFLQGVRGGRGGGKRPWVEVWLFSSLFIKKNLNLVEGPSKTRYQ